MDIVDKRERTQLNPGIKLNLKHKEEVRTCLDGSISPVDGTMICIINSPLRFDCRRIMKRPKLSVFFGTSLLGNMTFHFISLNVTFFFIFLTMYPHSPLSVMIG